VFLNFRAMIQRVQSIYLILFIVINIVLLSGLSILQFAGSGDSIKESITFDITSQKLHLQGQLNLPDSIVENFAEEIKSTPIQFEKAKQQLTWSKFSPLLLAQVLLLILAIITLFGYKNIKKQLRMARFTMFLTFIYVLLIMFLSYFTLGMLKPYIDEIPLEELIVARRLQFGFYIAVALFPLMFLAQLGIKKDLNLIKSLDRLR